MTYRERRERRAERLRGWAEKRDQRAAADLATGDKYRGDVAFNTQPGHIPERARLIARQDRAFSSLDKAASMSSKADEIDRQAAGAIYSDDHDAIPALEARIAGLEAQRTRIKTINAAIRKGPGWGERLPFQLTEKERTDLLSVARFQPYYDPEHKGFPPYVAQNIGGNITRQRARLAMLQQRAKVVAVLQAEREQEAS